MPENEGSAAAEGEEKEKTEGGEGQGGADSKKEAQDTDTGKEDAGKGEETEEGKGEEGGEEKETSKEDKSAKAPQKETSEEGKEEDQDPPVRKRLSRQDYIIGRKHKQLTKAKAGEEAGDDNESDEDDEVAPEDVKLIKKVVAKEFAPILDKTIDAADNEEIGEFLKENPDFAPYEAKVRKYIKHPSRRHLPIKAVFYEVAGDDLLKIGAARKEAADKKGKDTQTGGGSNRGGEVKKNAWQQSKEEFEADQEKVRRGEA